MRIRLLGVAPPPRAAPVLSWRSHLKARICVTDDGLKNLRKRTISALPTLFCSTSSATSSTRFGSRSK